MACSYREPLNVNVIHLPVLAAALYRAYRGAVAGAVFLAAGF
jgi:hypothetical protein